MRLSKEHTRESIENKFKINDDAKNELIQRSVTLIIIILYSISYYNSYIKKAE